MSRVKGQPVVLTKCNFLWAFGSETKIVFTRRVWINLRVSFELVARCQFQRSIRFDSQTRSDSGVFKWRDYADNCARGLCPSQNGCKHTFLYYFKHNARAFIFFFSINVFSVYFYFRVWFFFVLWKVKFYSVYCTYIHEQFTVCRRKFLNDIHIYFAWVFFIPVCI